MPSASLARPSRDARATGPSPVVVGVLAVALLVGAGAVFWLLGPGRAPVDPYAAPATAGSRAATPESRSYERGPDPAVVPPSGASQAAPPATAVSSSVAGLDAAQQAALAAATLAGSDAAQITADGIALTSGGSTEADTGPSSPAPMGTARPPQLAPALLSRAVAADLVGDAGSNSATDALKADARAQMLAYGYGADQWTCLDSVVTRESGWHVAATNVRSGAFGLPQALPATKMATAGADWQTNPRTQVAWMLDYVHRRYGDPCGAWAHELSAGWY